ncbi:MAG: hypothetical protein ACLSF1_13960 [Bacteroides thetaiotaomicron]
MKRTKYSIFIILFALLCPSCNSRKKSSHNDREIIAELGEEVLYTDELNTIIKQELFDELNKIYEIKKKAVEQLINVKLLQKEADKKQLSYQQYIDNYTDNQIQRLGIDSLSKRYNLKSIIEFRDANMYNVATNSPTGKISGLYRLKGFIIDNLLDSLKQNKRIVQYIYPPKSPSIDLSNLHTYYRGNLQSKVSIIIISDFDCESCINAHNLYET